MPAKATTNLMTDSESSANPFTTAGMDKIAANNKAFLTLAAIAPQSRPNTLAIINRYAYSTPVSSALFCVSSQAMNTEKTTIAATKIVLRFIVAPLQD